MSVQLSGGGGGGRGAYSHPANGRDPIWLTGGRVPICLIGSTPIVPDRGYPHPSQWEVSHPSSWSSRESTCYTAGGMPPAFTQEDFLGYSFCYPFNCHTRTEIHIFKTEIDPNIFQTRILISIVSRFICRCLSSLFKELWPFENCKMYRNVLKIHFSNGQNSLENVSISLKLSWQMLL